MKVPDQIPPRRRLIPLLLLLLAPARLAFPQSSLNGWAGWAECSLSVEGENYSDQQTQTWVLSGGKPAVRGAMRVYPAIWRVTGKGPLQRSEGKQTLSAQWTTNASGMSAPFAAFIRASDGKLIFKTWHSQLRARGAIAGTQVQSIDGKREPPVPISLEAFEWSVPIAEGDAKSYRLQGSSAIPITGSVGPMQPAGSKGLASCTWAFVKGSKVPPLPIAGSGAAAPAP